MDDDFMTMAEAAEEMSMSEADVWVFLEGMGISATLAELDRRQVVSRNRVNRALKTMRGELLADTLRRRTPSAEKEPHPRHLSMNGEGKKSG